MTRFLAHIVDYAVDNLIIHSNNGDKTSSGLSAVLFLVCCSARSATYNQYIATKTRVTIRETVKHNTQLKRQRGRQRGSRALFEIHTPADGQSFGMLQRQVCMEEIAFDTSTCVIMG